MPNNAPSFQKPHLAAPSSIQKPSISYEVSPEDEEMVDQYIDQLDATNTNNLTYEQNLNKYRQ
jgi:hypothetical protein